MQKVALRGHFDGERIVLDEPFDLPPHASLVVTINLPDGSGQTEDEDIWLRAISSSEAFAFLASPAEDVYTAEDGEPFRDAV